jgi:hypothetical protein
MIPPLQAARTAHRQQRYNTTVQAVLEKKVWRVTSRDAVEATLAVEGLVAATRQVEGCQPPVVMVSRALRYGSVDT